MECTLFTAGVVYHRYMSYTYSKLANHVALYCSHDGESFRHLRRHCKQTNLNYRRLVWVFRFQVLQAEIRKRLNCMYWLILSCLFLVSFTCLVMCLLHILIGKTLFLTEFLTILKKMNHFSPPVVSRKKLRQDYNPLLGSAICY